MSFGLQDERGFDQVFRPVGTTPERARRRYEWFAARAREVAARRSRNRLRPWRCGARGGRSDERGSARDRLSANFVAEAARKILGVELSYRALDIWSPEFDALGSFDLVIGNEVSITFALTLSPCWPGCALTSPAGGLAFIERPCPPRLPLPVRNGGRPPMGQARTR